MTTVLLITLFTLLSGIGDALGFLYAGRVWTEQQFLWGNALKSALGFQFGVAMYWCAVRQLRAQGVIDTEVQTLLWFGATIIGIAILSGQFLRWHALDQGVGLAVLCGIGFLLIRTAR
jgi:hypothetical protein